MKKEFFYPSEDGETKIHAIEWIPEGEIVGVLQLCHGMVEYIDRYDPYARFMAENGFYVVGHDHLGHGESVTSQEKLGYFHHPDGNACVIGDIHKLRVHTQKKYPGVPYFIQGHSMGSFLVRQYLGKYGEGLSGAVIVGTGDQPDIAVNSGKAICKLLAFFKGWEYRSTFVNNLSIGNYEKKLGKAWLSRNQDNVKAYVADPLCGFTFTLNGFYNLFDGILKTNRQEKSGSFNKELPMLFAAGEEDLVGNCGKGVKSVYHRYESQGAKDVFIKLYPKNRHEILNENDKDQVFADFLCWIKSKM